MGDDWKFITPFLGVLYLFRLRSRALELEKIKKLELFREERIRKAELLQFQTGPHEFHGAGVYHPTIPNLSKEQIFSFLVNGYLIVKVTH